MKKPEMVDPADILTGVVLVLAPHMDDEILACGGMLAALPDKHKLHVVYATDGALSPVPLYPWQGAVSPALPAVRKNEARRALAILGLTPENLHFWGLADGRLKEQKHELDRAMFRALVRLKPDQIIIPFRYDRHTDHLAVHGAALRALENYAGAPAVFEYFVYYRWRLLPGGDIRRYIHPNQLLALDTIRFGTQKKEALQAYRSQTTQYFPWQHRAILPPARVADVCSEPEYLLKHDPALPDTDIFISSHLWIRVVHAVEPFLKKKKEQLRNLI